MIGGSCAAILGGCVYDIRLLQADGVTRELWKTEDFASYLLVLKLNSHTTIKNIISVKKNDVGDSAVTCVCFYMKVLLAYSVSKKYVPWDECLVYHCTNTLCVHKF